MPDDSGVPEQPNPYGQALLRMVPKVGPVAAQLRDELFAREQRRYEEFQSALAEDLDFDQLVSRLFEDERFGDLLRDAVEAVARTRDRAKIRLLAKAFSSGALADDEASIDEAEQQVRLIAELDPVDIRALLALRDTSQRYGSPAGCLQHELHLTRATAALVYSRLLRNGLVETEPIASYDPADAPGEVMMNEAWGLSDAARAVLGLMDQIGANE